MKKATVKMGLVFLVLLYILSFALTSCGNSATNVTSDNNFSNGTHNDVTSQGTDKSHSSESEDYSHLILGAYQKNLDLIDGDYQQLIVELIHQYTASSFAIEKLGQIRTEDLASESTASMLKETMDSMDGLLTLSAVSDYLLDRAINQEENGTAATRSSKGRIVQLSTNDDPVEWAKAITQKYDSIKGTQKLKELAGYMGTDAKRAYQSLEIAQNILQGEYASEEERAEEWLSVLNATKTASKVGVYLCATAVTCGATGAVGTATTLTANQTAGIIINGVDCVLTMGSEGANIILGEDSETAKCLSTVANVYSKCNYIYGLFNAPDTLGEKIAFISDTTELVNDSVSYFFNVDPLGNGGQLITSIIDSASNDYSAEAIEDLKLGGAYSNQETTATADSFLQEEKGKLAGDDLDFHLKSEEINEIVTQFNKSHKVESPIVRTENGLSYRSDSYKGYCYRDKAGYLDGEMVQFDYDSTYGEYIVSKRIYSHGVQTEYRLFEPDGLLIYQELFDSESGMLKIESFHSKTVEDNINPTTRGYRAYTEYRSVSYPSKEEVDNQKDYGCCFAVTDYVKTIRYEPTNDQLVKSVTEVNEGIIIHSLSYVTDNDVRYLAFETTLNEEGNKISKTYMSNGRLARLWVIYPDDQSDGEEYEYGEDEGGTYKYISYYTNDNYISTSDKIYD